MGKKLPNDGPKQFGDTHRPFEAVLKSVPSAVDQLLKIQRHLKRQPDPEWIESNLEVLYKKSTVVIQHGRDKPLTTPSGRQPIELGRKRLHPGDGNYVVLSYVWGSSKMKPDETGGYLVDSKDPQKNPANAKVRDAILDRLLKYTSHCNQRYFWIDNECIEQEAKNPGIYSEEYETERRIAYASMHQVYKHSKFPVGFLSIQISSRRQMEILRDLLDRYYHPTPGIRRLETLELLEHIISDEWWERAWVYQEDYVSTTRMALLIRHEAYLEDMKLQGRKVFDGLPGEACINLTKLRAGASRFCDQQLHNLKRDTLLYERLKKVLHKLAKYSELLFQKDEYGASRSWSPMWPHIIEQVGNRKVSKNIYDRIDIMANCCAYSLRFKNNLLEKEGYSLSLCYFALCLLNGEIFDNNSTSNKSNLTKRIFGFLKRQSLNNFRPPVSQYHLSFIKNCRFGRVSLTRRGIETKGHLWRLGKSIRPETLRKNRFTLEEGSAYLSPHQVMRLKQLAHELNRGYHRSCYYEIPNHNSICHRKRYRIMAREISNYLKEDRGRHIYDRSFVPAYKSLGAKEITNAMDTNKTLYLASLVYENDTSTSFNTCTPYRGIFVGDSPELQSGSYIFISSFPGDGLDESKRYVSLVVDVLDDPERPVPSLVVKRWVNGLCFFTGCRMRNVVFPWPDYLL